MANTASGIWLPSYFPLRSEGLVAVTDMAWELLVVGRGLSASLENEEERFFDE
jgi:hypothetical protein